jgi:drug/metabolite transporter (DMT)-like permease
MGILLGLVSALVWGVAGVTGGLAARRLGGMRAVGYSMLASILVALPLALVSGLPGRIDERALLWLLFVAGTGLGGLMLLYTGLRIGKISTLVPISATYGGFGAVIAIAAGEPTSPLAFVGLALAVVGAILASRGEASAPGGVYAHQTRAALLAGGAALAWGVQLWAGGQIQDDVGASWVVAFMRLLGALAIGVPILMRGPLVRDARILGLAAITGIGEVFGFTLFLLASAYGVAQAAVLTGQYGTVAALIGVLVLKERLRGMQFVGLGLIVAAVILLALPG